MKRSEMEKEMQELLERPGAYLVLPADMTLREAASMAPAELLIALVESRKPKEGWELEGPVLPERLEYTGSGGGVSPLGLPVVVGEEMVVDPAAPTYYIAAVTQTADPAAKELRRRVLPAMVNAYNRIQEAGGEQETVVVNKHFYDLLCRQAANVQRCVWTEDGEGFRDSDCGRYYAFTDRGPVFNKFAFCPFCSKPVIEARDEDGGEPAEVGS